MDVKGSVQLSALSFQIAVHRIGCGCADYASFDGPIPVRYSLFSDPCSLPFALSFWVEVKCHGGDGYAYTACLPDDCSG